MFADAKSLAFLFIAQLLICWLGLIVDHPAFAHLEKCSFCNYYYYFFLF